MCALARMKIYVSFLHCIYCVYKAAQYTQQSTLFLQMACLGDAHVIYG